jgi:hypothetical protein
VDPAERRTALIAVSGVGLRVHAVR